MHPDEFCPTLFRIGGPALKVWDLIRYSSHDELLGGGPRSSCEKIIAAGSSLEHAGFDWVDDERAVAKKRKRAGSTSGRGKNILFEFEMNLERLINAMLALRDLCSPNYSRGRRASSARRSDIKMLRDEVGGLSVALVLIMVDYIILSAVDDLAPLITERAAMIFQNSKLGVNERLDEVNRMIRAEYYRVVQPAPPRSKTPGRSDGRKQPPRAPSPPRGYHPTSRTRSISPSSRSSSWHETSVSSYDDFKGRQSRPQQRRNDGYSVTSSEVSSSTYEDVPELSYESSEDDAYYYYDETESASSDNSSDIGTLGARVDDRWNCDPWHKENRRRGSVSQNDRGRVPREHQRQHSQHQQQQQQRPQTPGRREERGRDRGHTPPPRFSQTHFRDARNIAGDRALPPRTPVTPRTPGGGDFSRHAPPPHPPQFAPYTPTPHSRGAPRQAPHVTQYPPPPPPRFSSHPPPPPQRRFSNSYVPMPDGPVDSRQAPPVSPRYPPGQYDLTFAGGKFPSYATPSRNPQGSVKMVPGLGGPIPMPMGFMPSNTGMKAPAPTPGYVHPRRVSQREYAPAPLPRSSTWPPSSHKRQTFGGFGYV